MFDTEHTLSSLFHSKKLCIRIDYIHVSVTAALKFCIYYDIRKLNSLYNTTLQFEANKFWMKSRI